MNPHTATLVKGAYSEAADTARALYDDGKYKEAIKKADSVLNGDAPESIKLKVLHTKGAALWEIGQSDACFALLAEAGPLIDRAEPRSRASFFGQRALLFRSAGRLDDAMVDYEEARFWAQEAGDQQIEARVRSNLAKVYTELGRFEEANKESDAAIALAESLGEIVLAGRFYDLKAQNLVDQEKYGDALTCSLEAINRLDNHPSGAEARTTHAKALDAAIKDYLSATDTVDTFRLRRVIVNALTVKLDVHVVRLALKRSQGNVYSAAKLLNVKHPSLLEAIEKFDLVDQQKVHRQPKRRRVHKSLIKISK